MYEFDHMLNGRGSRQHLQQMVREAQQEKFARDVEDTQSKHQKIALLRAILTTLLHFLTK
jgi:hypothetical protein